MNDYQDKVKQKIAQEQKEIFEKIIDLDMQICNLTQELHHIEQKRDSLIRKRNAFRSIYTSASYFK